ncbi:hypothetical protein EV363DRAFT_1164027 [Boletus edulis]|uniref:Uncharacterized protein n=1 Tax=Boletus edulis BED1 TaxID=1328754 RepID=A0AAD4BZK7_BOLED|nr:hypothetical protein EV363DRAFT_1164027 [Boletus edulis]KAF8444011.1 hypothetical protein L210DRAFT_595064 [Boletus edulis BED1]
MDFSATSRSSFLYLLPLTFYAPRRAISSAVGPAIQDFCSIAFSFVSSHSHLHHSIHDSIYDHSIYDHSVCRFVDFCILRLLYMLSLRTIDLNDIDDHFVFRFWADHTCFPIGEHLLLMQ